jgi:8-oxo-dGTP pyrophosphatase MutT (NUDIX family)
LHRQLLLDLLGRYLERHPADRARVDHVRNFVRLHPDCFERTCVEGHVTGSAWIVSSDHREVLLTHHRKLDRWLQLGGHADGDSEPHRVALREAREESGMERFAIVSGDAKPESADAPLPLDVDVHLIPAHGDEPAHLHHDIRYLLVAAPGQAIVVSEESRELRWFAADQLARLPREDSLLRMERRARELLDLPGFAPGLTPRT